MDTMLEKIIAFNRATFDKTFTNILVIQDQMEKIVNMYLEKAPWIPEQGKKAITDMFSSCKKGCKDFKEAVDEVVLNSSHINDYYAKWFDDSSGK